MTKGPDDVRSLRHVPAPDGRSDVRGLAGGSSDVVVLRPDVVATVVQRCVKLVEVRLELFPRLTELVGVGALPDGLLTCPSRVLLNSIALDAPSSRPLCRLRRVSRSPPTSAMMYPPQRCLRKVRPLWTGPMT